MVFAQASSDITICVAQNGTVYIVGVGGFTSSDCTSSDTLFGIGTFKDPKVLKALGSTRSSRFNWSQRPQELKGKR